MTVLEENVKNVKRGSSLSWKSSSVFIVCDQFSWNITFSSQFFLFCQIALLNFDFCCFLTLNYLNGFARKRKKGLSLSCRKHSYSHLLCAIFFNFVTLHSFIQYFRNFWKKSKNLCFLVPKSCVLECKNSFVPQFCGQNWLNCINLILCAFFCR